MFTGLVEEIGTVAEIADHGDSAQISITGPQVITDAEPGHSIAVNGCCLTVTEHWADTFRVDVMRETLWQTSLGSLRPGDPVNLERAMRVDGRYGGHLVQGHVDGTGAILERVHGERWEIVRIALPAELARYVVAKGSITVDGISLTVVEVRDGERPEFTVSLIPETLRATTLGTRAEGDRVNLEVDVLAKYVERLLGDR